MIVRHRCGDTTIFALTDAEGPFFRPREQAFPQADTEQWRMADTTDPDAVTADGRWWLKFRAFAIRHEDTGSVTMVDAGIGPSDSLAADWAPVPGRLPAELAAAGIDPADVDTVVLTHLHTDHVGWAVVGDPGRPYFRNAAYLLPAADLAAVDTDSPRLRDRLVTPLRDSGRLHALDGETTVSSRVSVVPTPGHTPGHHSVLVRAGDELVAVTGDVLVHTIQLLYPELGYALEDDPLTARHSRRALLDRVRRADGLIATPHLTEPFLPVRAVPDA